MSTCVGRQRVCVCVCVCVTVCVCVCAYLVLSPSTESVYRAVRGERAVTGTCGEHSRCRIGRAR
jgi:hypothetical protein